MSRLSTSPLRKKAPIKPPSRKPNHRKPCRDAKHFTVEECKLIYDLKGAYRSMPGKNYVGRRQYIENHVNPRLQAYWRGKGLTDCIVEPDGIVEKWDELIKNYVRKNWRSVIATAPLKAPSLRITKSNYIYNTERKAVITKIRGMLEEDEELMMGLISKHRHQAVRNILQDMNDEELQDLEDKIEEAKIVGYTPEVKERIYMKRCNQCMQQAAHLQHIEMGTLSIQVSVFMDQEGQTHIQFHDHARELLGMNTKSFEDTFPNELNDLANVFEKYVQKLLSIKSRMSVNRKDESQPHAVDGLSSAAAEHGNTRPSASVPESDEACLARYRLAASQLRDGAMDRTVKITEEGFPILPSPWPSNLNKKLQNKYYAKFMKAHYDLARSGRGDQTPVPWTALNNNPHEFFHEVKAHKEDDNPSGAMLSRYPGPTLSSPNLLLPNKLVKPTPHTMTRPQDTPTLFSNSAMGNAANDLTVVLPAESHGSTTTEPMPTEVTPISKEEEQLTLARIIGTKSHLITPIESAKRPRNVKEKMLSPAAGGSSPITDKQALLARGIEQASQPMENDHPRGRCTHKTPSKVPVIVSNITSTL
ncbi:hypothetical protein BJ165DRAFT_1535557 [Panaeolus papilionaceus]|nr:hypothetical protein BJ165DRAFT_1535557 [Panaeolus papilionaceus]